MSGKTTRSSRCSRQSRSDGHATTGCRRHFARTGWRPIASGSRRKRRAMRAHRARSNSGSSGSLKMERSTKLIDEESRGRDDDGRVDQQYQPVPRDSMRRSPRSSLHRRLRRRRHSAATGQASSVSTTTAVLATSAGTIQRASTGQGTRCKRSGRLGQIRLRTVAYEGACARFPAPDRDSVQGASTPRLCRTARSLQTMLASPALSTLMTNCDNNAVSRTKVDSARRLVW